MPGVGQRLESGQVAEGGGTGMVTAADARAE